VTKWNSVNVTGEVDLTTPKNEASSREEGTSFEGQNLTTIANQTRNVTEASPENNTTKTTVAPNNKTGNPIIDFFKGMFGT
jgi:hypothetical protein